MGLLGCCGGGCDVHLRIAATVLTILNSALLLVCGSCGSHHYSSECPLLGYRICKSYSLDQDISASS